MSSRSALSATASRSSRRGCCAGSSLGDGRLDGVAGVLAQLFADLGVEGDHVLAGAGDHRSDVRQDHVIDFGVDPDGLAGAEELGGARNLDATPPSDLNRTRSPARRAPACPRALPRSSPAANNPQPQDPLAPRRVEECQASSGKARDEPARCEERSRGVYSVMLMGSLGPSTMFTVTGSPGSTGAGTRYMFGPEFSVQ